jgi:hypothetical protein
VSNQQERRNDMNDNIKIEVSPDGHAHVEGSLAIEAEIQHRRNDNGDIELLYTFTAAGDDAMHAGSLEAVFTLTKPEYVPQSPLPKAKQSKIGAEYATGMIECAKELIGDGLREAFSEAVQAATEEAKAENEDALETVTRLVQSIALMLLALNRGDKDKAKAQADLTSNPALRAEAEKAGLCEEHIEQATALIREAIDLADVSGA